MKKLSNNLQNYVNLSNINFSHNLSKLFWATFFFFNSVHYLFKIDLSIYCKNKKSFKISSNIFIYSK